MTLDELINRCKHEVQRVGANKPAAYDLGYREAFNTCYKLLQEVKDSYYVRRSELKGHWEETMSTFSFYFECSVCKKLSQTRSDYCPHCGSMMKG